MVSPLKERYFTLKAEENDENDVINFTTLQSKNTQGNYPTVKEKRKD